MKVRRGLRRKRRVVGDVDLPESKKRYAWSNQRTDKSQKDLRSSNKSLDSAKLREPTHEVEKLTSHRASLPDQAMLR